MCDVAPPYISEFYNFADVTLLFYFTALWIRLNWKTAVSSEVAMINHDILF